MLVYVSKDYVTFLSLNKKVTKEVSQRGARCKCAPFGNPRRTFERAPSSILLRTDGRKSAHFRLIGKVFGPFNAGGVFFKRGRLVQSPLLNRLLFALFLPNQEKGRRNVRKINDHLPQQQKNRHILTDVPVSYSFGVSAVSAAPLLRRRRRRGRLTSSGSAFSALRA